MDTNLARAQRRALDTGDARKQLLAGVAVTERRLRLAGVSTSLLEGGEGPPILLLHGPGGYGAVWLQVIPDLSAAHRVIAPDLPGQDAAPAQAWDAIAAGYERYVAPQEEALAGEALRRVALKPGEHFLDVAAGTGALSLPAARIGARVLATDFSPAMIDRFEARVRDEGLSNAEGRVMDCHALDLTDDSFDVAGSQFGVMLVPEQATALREMVRVTKPGGRVLVVAFASPAELEFLQFFTSALDVVAPDLPRLSENPPPLEFQLADPQVLRRRLTDAGLKEARVERSAERLELGSGQEMWDWVLNSNPIAGMLVADLTERQRTSLRQVLDGMLRERAVPTGPAILTNAVNIGIGIK